MVFDGGAVLEQPSGGAQERILTAVEDTGEFVTGHAIEVVGDDFGVLGEGGGIVGELGLGDAGADALLATQGVVGDGDIGGVVAVVGAGHQAVGVAVCGGDASRPRPGEQAPCGGVGVVGAFAMVNNLSGILN